MLNPVQALALALALLMVLALHAGRATAQTTRPRNEPTPLDMKPLARYVPKENLVLLVECNGLDAQGEAWKKTAAYKMLNETPLGEMLESLTTQLADRALAIRPGAKATGADVVAMLKHAIQKGFVIGIGSFGQDKSLPLGLVVVRGGTSREVRVPFSKALGTLMGEDKPKLTKLGTHSIVSVPSATRKEGAWVWWSEGNDLLVGLAGTDQKVLAVLDGKGPSAEKHPARAELTATVDGFTPVLWAILDPSSVPESGPAMNVFLGKLKSAVGLELLVHRWGFQNDALMSITRIKAPRPRKNLLALLEQPSFEKTKLPPLPEGLESFAVVSLDSTNILKVLEGFDPSVKAGIENLKTKHRIDLRKDLLAHVGPRMAGYVMPGGAAPRPPADGTTAPPPGGPGGGAGLPDLNAFASLAGGQVPRLTIVTDVDDPEAFAKSLDNLMVAVNKELKARAADATAKEEDAAEKSGSGGNSGLPPGYPGAPTAGAVGGDGRTRRRGPLPSAEFKLMPSKDAKERIYQLSVPPTLSRSFPPGLRPTVRLGGKFLVIATAADAARLAMDLKAGEWTPPADLTATFDRLPKSMFYLGVNDPRSTLPDVLASLPKNLQAGVNSAIIASQARLKAAAGAGAAAGEDPGRGGNPSGAGRPGGPPVGIASGGGEAGGPRRGMMPGAPGSGGPGAGYPGAGYPGAPSAVGGAPAGGVEGEPPALLTLEVDPAKLPKPEDLRSRLFPGATAVSADDEGITILSRHAFPNAISPSTAMGVALVLPAIQSARNAAAASGAPSRPASSAPAGSGERRGGRGGAQPGGVGGSPKAD